MKNQQTTPIVLILALFSWPLLAQTEDIKWGKIPAQELQMTVYEPDTSAAAVVLANMARVSFDLGGQIIRIFFDCHRRIKILKRQGFDQGDISIAYVSGDKNESLSDLKAQIIQPDGSKRALERKDFFEEKVNDYVTRIKFSFPEIKVGSIIEYRYTKSNKNYFQLPDWYFQEDIPVVLSQYDAHIPEYFNYVQLQVGTPPQHHKADQTRETLPNGNSISMVHYQLAARNMPAMPTEAFITTMDDYLSRVRFQLSGTSVNGVVDPILTTWEKVATLLDEHEHFGRKIHRRGSYDQAYQALLPLVQGETSPEVKTLKIYDFLRQKIEWNGKETYLADEPLEDCLARHSGDAAEINLLLVALLQAFDIKAQPMLLSTRDHGAPFQQYPIVDQFNYVVAWVNLGDKTLCLDATHAYRPAGQVAENALNRVGWVADPKEPHWERIPSKPTRFTQMFNVELVAEDTLAGKLSASFEGEAALEQRDAYHEASKATAAGADAEQVEAEEEVSTGPQIHFEELKIINEEDVYKPLQINGKVKVSAAVITNGSTKYISPFLEPFFAENPLKRTTRLYPIDIPEPMSFRYIFNFVIPEGYTLVETPQQAMVTFGGDDAKFSLLVQNNNNRLQITSHLQINKIHYEPDDYADFKEFFNQIIAKQQEQVVIKKVAGATE